FENLPAQAFLTFSIPGGSLPVNVPGLVIKINAILNDFCDAEALGILSPSLPVTAEEWLSALEEVMPGRVLEANRNAFVAGRDLGSREGPGGEAR
ncbi:MAG: hypothetical protein MUO75_05585, partial [Actinobacteria bacterium]|nr:hypothetical protein [Actinomycetota bacterium]